MTLDHGAPGTLPAAIKGALDVSLDEGGMSVRRLPAWTQAQFGGDVPLAKANSTPSGVRLEFLTDAAWLELDLTFTRESAAWRWRPLQAAVISLTTSDGHAESRDFHEGDVLETFPDGPSTLAPGAPSTARFEIPGPRQERTVTLWLPHRGSARIHGIRSERPVQQAARTGPRWVHYGSSISQSSHAEAPLGVWPIIAARNLGLDLYNLGLAGSAHLDQFVARTIRDQPAHLITLKVGINIINSASLRRRTFAPALHGFLDTVRDGHPETPLVLISPIFCPEHEDAPGPSRLVDGKFLATDVPRKPGDGLLTLRDARSILAEAVSERGTSDPNLHYLDGLRLFGSADAHLLPDRLHPDAEGYGLIGERFTAIAAGSPWLAPAAQARVRS
ncbi:lysophospholipase L1-like esterase [Arthrobacter sp. SORGH_AS 212]|uniref:SGNH/GDSL hydrolase family protein n=1 Tax=Pseudarthrobacter sp. SORGH_AS 212 TaxID=3041777 RepID=UPI002786D34F|nr:lysophospholipase L1-like esterase [Arthrobacter sp. SORGH_AS_0212]